MLKPILKPKLILAVLVAIFSFALAQPALAATDSGSAACQGLQAVDPNACKTPGQAGNTLGGIVGTVINIISILVGAVAVIMILVAGFRFITSGGGEGVKAARSTLIYALVGIAVAVLAQVLLHFVIYKLSNSS